MGRASEPGPNLLPMTEKEIKKELERSSDTKKWRFKQVKIRSPKTAEMYLRGEFAYKTLSGKWKCGLSKAEKHSRNRDLPDRVAAIFLRLTKSDQEKALKIIERYRRVAQKE